MKKIFYRVKKGETLFDICTRFSLPIMAVISTNNLTKEVSEGDILYLETENRRVYVVTPKDSYESIEKKLSVCKEQLISLNQVPYVFYGLRIYY